MAGIPTNVKEATTSGYLDATCHDMIPSPAYIELTSNQQLFS